MEISFGSAEESWPLTDGSKPGEESLRHLNAADIRHIAEMKAAQHSYFKWVIGLGSAFIGLQSTKALPAEFVGPVGLGVALIASFTALYIWDCHLSTVRIRKRLWKVYKDLRLQDYIGKNEGEHTSFWYGWKVWIPMVLICVSIAIWSAKQFFEHLELWIALGSELTHDGASGGALMSLNFDLAVWTSISAIGAFVVTSVGACVGISGYCRYRHNWNKKTKALVDYLKSKKELAKDGKKGQQTTLHLIRYVGLTEDEILKISFENEHVHRTVDTDEDGKADTLFFEYKE